MLILNLHTVLRIESKKKDNEKDASFFHIYKWSNARKLQTCLPPDLQSSGSSWWGGEVRRILSGKCCEQAGEKAGRRCLTSVHSREDRSRATVSRAEGAALPHFSVSALSWSSTREPGAMLLQAPSPLPVWPAGWSSLEDAPALIPTQPCSLPLSQRPPIPAGHPNSTAACIQKGNYHCTGEHHRKSRVKQHIKYTLLIRHPKPSLKSDVPWVHKQDSNSTFEWSSII